MKVISLLAKVSKVFLIKKFHISNAITKGNQLLTVQIIGYNYMIPLYTGFEIINHIHSLKILRGFSNTMKKQRIYQYFATKNNTTESISNEYPSAIWAEREIFDMLGVFFKSSRDLRKILTNYGSFGYPLRKIFPVIGFFDHSFYSPSNHGLQTNPFNVNNVTTSLCTSFNQKRYHTLKVSTGLLHTSLRMEKIGHQHSLIGYSRITIRGVHTATTAAARLVNAVVSPQLIKASGFVAIGSNVRQEIISNTNKGIWFKKLIIFNAMKTAYDLYGNGPIQDNREYCERIYNTVQSYNHGVFDTKVNPLFTSNALSQHFTTSFTIGQSFDTTIIEDLSNQMIDYSNYKQGVHSIQIREVALLKNARADWFKLTPLQNATLLRIIAINPDNLIPQQVLNAAPSKNIQQQLNPDFALSYLICLDNGLGQKVLVRFLDAKCPILPAEITLPGHRGLISLSPQLNVKAYLGQLYNSFKSNLNNCSVIEKDAINSLIKELDTLKSKGKPDYNKIINALDKLYFDPNITSVIPTYIAQAPIDTGFKTLFVNNETHFIQKIVQKASDNSLDINAWIPKEQYISTMGSRDILIELVDLFPKAIQDEIVDNYYRIKSLT